MDDNKTLKQACDELDEHWTNLWMGLVYMLRIPVILGWLTRLISILNNLVSKYENTESSGVTIQPIYESDLVIISDEIRDRWLEAESSE